MNEKVNNKRLKSYCSKIVLMVMKSLAKGQ